MPSRIPSQWYDDSEGIASFPGAAREPVWPDMKSAQAGNSDRIQGCLNEHETNAYIPLDCFAGE